MPRLPIRQSQLNTASAQLPAQCEQEIDEERVGLLRDG